MIISTSLTKKKNRPVKNLKKKPPKKLTKTNVKELNELITKKKKNRHEQGII